MWWCVAQAWGLLDRWALGALFPFINPVTGRAKLGLQHPNCLLTALSCPRTTQVTSKDLHLGVLPFQPRTAAAAAAPAGATSTATVGAPAAEAISEEGLDWKLPVIVLVLFIAASTTILQPAVVDIFQLRPLPPPSAADTLAGSSFKAAGNGASGSAGASAAAARAAVAAAAAVAVPDDSTSEWASDAEQRSLGVKSKGNSMRSRSTRRA